MEGLLSTPKIATLVARTYAAVLKSTAPFGLAFPCSCVIFFPPQTETTCASDARRRLGSLAPNSAAAERINFATSHLPLSGWKRRKEFFEVRHRILDVERTKRRRIATGVPSG